MLRWCSGLFQAGQRSPALLPGQHQPWTEPENLNTHSLLRCFPARLPQAAPLHLGVPSRGTATQL